jgi:general secretion pathway protein N
MIDTRDNLLTTVLAGFIAALVLIALVSMVFLGQVNVARLDPMGETSVPPLNVAEPEVALEDLDQYAEIVRRPVFFSDRRLPVVELASAEEEAPPAIEVIEEEEPVAPLAAAVAGIIITPELRMAMIRDQSADRTLLMREGMNMEGEQAAWKLSNIDSRLVQFVSADGQSTGLELEVNTSGLTRSSTAATDGNEGEPQGVAAEGAESAAPPTDEATRSRAEEIRRRVAERRAELRAEAERRAREQQENP